MSISARAAYSSVNKETVRNLIHSEFADWNCKTVLFLPSTQRYELDSLLSFGYCVEDLHAVECRRAKMAWVTGRLLPNEQGLHRHRCLLSEVGPRLVKAGVKIEAANLDFCCTIKIAAPEISAFVGSGALSSCSLVAIQVSIRNGAAGYLRDIEIEKAIKKGLTNGWTCEKLFPGTTYYNEESVSNMHYTLYHISEGVTE